MVVAKRILIAALLCLLFLSAQGAAFGAEPPRPTTVKLVTTDNVVIVGSLYEVGRGKNPAVLMMHMMGRDRADYDRLARDLQSKGIVCLSIDLRGHGESIKTADGSRTLNHKQFSEADFGRMLLDVKAGHGFLAALPIVDPGRIGMVGASIGANAAINHASEKGGVRALVLLSPGLNYHGLTTEEAAANLQGCKLLLAAAEDDQYSARTVRELKARARVPAELLVYPTGGHGTRLMENRPELYQEVIRFLAQSL